MTYNNERWQQQPDPHRVANAMRHFWQNRRGGQGDGYGGDYDNRRDGGSYNEIPGYNPGNPYEEPGHYEQRPHSSMGFNPYQNDSRHRQPYSQQEYGRPHHEYQRDELEFDKRMDDYFRRINEGRTQVPDSLCDVVATGVSMYMGNSGDGSQDATHARYKEAIERIREASNMQEKEKLIKELFTDDLTPDEMVVLRDKAMAKSYHQKAREKWGNNGSYDRWLEAAKNLKYKLKHSA